jgi:hypothetical protein
VRATLELLAAFALGFVIALTALRLMDQVSFLKETKLWDLSLAEILGISTGSVCAAELRHRLSKRRHRLNWKQ